jgi:hypothetical protein
MVTVQFVLFLECCGFGALVTVHGDLFGDFGVLFDKEPEHLIQLLIVLDLNLLVTLHRCQLPLQIRHLVHIFLREWRPLPYVGMDILERTVYIV